MTRREVSLMSRGLSLGVIVGGWLTLAMVLVGLWILG